ncbi:MAG: glycogen debranching enzyme N-terminal domain-containing protein, partial [Armatimonadota bacterium]
MSHEALYTDMDEWMGDEWLETNGLGGFASSTVPCCNTRRYHGLLVADPAAQTEGAPSGRRVLLNKLEERLIFDDTEIGLSCNIYPDTCHPQGYRYLVDFQRRPWPTFTWETQ